MNNELHFLHIRVFSDNYMQLVRCHTSSVHSVLPYDQRILVFFHFSPHSPAFLPLCVLTFGVKKEIKNF
jgi:hypothetical protein